MTNMLSFPRSCVGMQTQASIFKIKPNHSVRFASTPAAEGCLSNQVPQRSLIYHLMINGACSKARCNWLTSALKVAS